MELTKPLVQCTHHAKCNYKGCSHSGVHNPATITFCNSIGCMNFSDSKCLPVHAYKSEIERILEI